MLIVCNGAPKSGSTWLYNIVERLRPGAWPDRSFLTKSKKHPTIRPDALPAFLATDVYRDADYICKSHYGKQAVRDQLLASPYTLVLDMERDLRDVLVSSYYDSCRRDGFRGSFSQYYWLEGRSLADYLGRYHRVWDNGHPQVFRTTFEALKTEFIEEARRIADFLGCMVTDEQLAELESATSLGALREAYKDDPQYATAKNPFFRKGEIGDWKNHFDERMVSDIQRIESQGLSSYDLYEFRSRVRRRIHRLIPALSPYRPGLEY
jgi:hypothetical protein